MGEENKKKYYYFYTYNGGAANGQTMIGNGVCVVSNVNIFPIVELERQIAKSKSLRFAYVMSFKQVVKEFYEYYQQASRGQNGN